MIDVTVSDIDDELETLNKKNHKALVIKEWVNLSFNIVETCLATYVIIYLMYKNCQKKAKFKEVYYTWLQLILLWTQIVLWVIVVAYLIVTDYDAERDGDLPDWVLNLDSIAIYCFWALQWLYIVRFAKVSLLTPLATN